MLLSLSAISHAEEQRSALHGHSRGGHQPDHVAMRKAVARRSVARRGRCGMYRTGAHRPRCREDHRDHDVDHDHLDLDVDLDDVDDSRADDRRCSTFSPQTPEVLQVVNFTSQSTPGTGRTIVRYDWDFGDGSRQDRRHVHARLHGVRRLPGHLTVTDDSGDTARSSETGNGQAESSRSERPITAVRSADGSSC